MTWRKTKAAAQQFHELPSEIRLTGRQQIGVRVRRMANATEECEVKICEVGGEGLFLPLFGDAEQVWPSGLRGFLYLIGLLWTFIGVAIVADVFMSSIETITSKKKRVVDPKTGRNYTSKAARTPSPTSR
ncbi:unnamed protein product [Durusdinium trenchii]|uniref:Uncharacterized protein n=1 Tax=Durusdinium trenchii TaxID=1381693 RepID=A0ABP0KC34_9DINO